MRDPCGDGILCLHYYGGHINLHVIKLHRIKHTHTSAHKTGEIWLKSLDGINVSFVAVILYYRHAR